MAIVWESSGSTLLALSGLNGTKASEGKTSGKWYWEVKVISGTYQVIGVAGTGSVYWGKTMDVNCYTASGWMVINYNTQIGGWPRFYTGDTIGIALDIPNDKLTFYLNGDRLEEAPHMPSALQGSVIYAYAGRAASAGSATMEANFGSTEFDIVTQNPSEWMDLLTQGYIPYEPGADWFVVPIIEAYSNINETYNQLVNVGGTITHREGTNTRYRLVINGVGQSWTNFLSVPITIDASVNPLVLNYGDNVIVVEAEDIDGGIGMSSSLNITRIVTELIQPQEVYANKVEIRWKPILSPSLLDMDVKLFRSENSDFSLNVKSFNVNLQSEFYIDTQVQQDKSYYYKLRVR